MAKGTTTTRETGVVAVDHDKLTVARLVEIMEQGGMVQIVGEDSEEMAAAITRRKAGATTAEELLQPLDLLKVKDNEKILGKPFKLLGVGVRNSDDAFMEEGSLGIYVVLNTTIGPIGTGSKDIVITALRLVELKALPQWVRITQTQSKSTQRPVFNMTGVPADQIPEEAF